MKGYFYIIDTLKTELESIPLVNTVTQGSIDDIDNWKQSLFPLCHIIVNSITPQGSIIAFNISIIAMDLVDISKAETTDKFTGNDNEVDVLNTQMVVLMRLYEVLRRGDLYSDNFQIVDNPTIEPFTERFENYLAGMTMTFNVIIPNQMSICTDEPTPELINVYSQVIDFELNPYNSIIYECDGSQVQACYSPTNCTNITDLVNLFNSSPTPTPSCPNPLVCYCWSNYGTYYDNGDGRIRCEMTQAQFDSLNCGGELTLNVIYD